MLHGREMCVCVSEWASLDLNIDTQACIQRFFSVWYCCLDAGLGPNFVRFQFFSFPQLLWWLLLASCKNNNVVILSMFSLSLGIECIAWSLEVILSRLVRQCYIHTLASIAFTEISSKHREMEFDQGFVLFQPTCALFGLIYGRCQ